MHVGATEGVDGLLRVADEDEGRVGIGVTEERREDAPLHRVGVLELVDEGDGEPLPERRCSRSITVHGVAEPREDIVEGERPRRVPARACTSLRTRSTSCRRRAAAGVDSASSVLGTTRMSGFPITFRTSLFRMPSCRQLVDGPGIGQRLRGENVGAGGLDDVCSCRRGASRRDRPVSWSPGS